MGEISDKINEMIQRVLQSSEWTSASPGFTNTFVQTDATENIDFENDIKKLIKESPEGKQLKKQDKGNIGEINRFTSTQFANIRELATNPTGFIIQTFLRKFTKGVGVVAFALIIFEAVKWVIGELLKPGRFLDLRFKRNINDELIAFRKREDQQRLKQGLSSVIITSTPRLRLTASNASQVTNTLNMVGGRQQFPDNIGAESKLLSIASGRSLSKNAGRRSFSR